MCAIGTNLKLCLNKQLLIDQRKRRIFLEFCLKFYFFDWEINSITHELFWTDVSPV